MVQNENDDRAERKRFLRLLQDEQLMIEMEERNRQKAHLFSIDTIYSQWENLIKSVVKNG